MGKNSDGGHSQWFGSISEMRFRKRALVKDELLASMFGLSNPHDSTLVLWMKFNEQAAILRPTERIEYLLDTE